MTASNEQRTDAGAKGLSRMGGLAALVAVVFFRRNWAAELWALDGFGLYRLPEGNPVTALEWFEILNESPFLGLQLFDGLDLVNYALVGVLFLALFSALRQANRSVVTLATVVGLMGVAVYLVSNQAVTMWTLSRQYAAAASEAHRSMLRAAGETLLAFHNPGIPTHGTGIHVGLFLVLLAGLLFSVVMLRSSAFGKATAIVGLLANGLCITFPLFLGAGLLIYGLPTIISAPFRVAWMVMVALRLFKLVTVNKT